MLAEGARYLDDPAFRRRTLEESFVNPDNTYSRLRLAHYALGARGWDLLPAWNPRSVPLAREHVERLRRGEALELPPDTPPLWDGVRPTTMAGWVALGERVFFGYPLRVEVFLRHAVAHPELGAKVGVVAAADGGYPGARVFVDDVGHTEVGLSCAQCHARVVKGAVRAGEARREFDYGRLRLAYHEATREPVDAELARRMATWGPGRADVTEDETEDPVAIPDLWGLRHQTALTQAGTLRHVGPTVLAIRQETQLLHTNHQRVRPPRELAWALAMYLYALDPPDDQGSATARPRAQQLARGRAVFDDRCRSCHANAAYGGEPVDAAKVGTDPSFATGRARGTGRYRPPALIRVRDAAPYLHDGSVATLDELLATRRLDASYRGPLGVRAAPGHTFGADLGSADRAALLAWLRAL